MFKINTQAPVHEEREPFFEIDGVEYTIPKVVGGEIMLEAMERMRSEPDAAVTAWCVEQVIGADAWRALRAVKGLDPSITRGVMETCRKKVFGAMEEEGKG